MHNLAAVTSLGLKAEETAKAAISDIEQGRKPILMLFNTMESTVKDFVDSHNELAQAHNAEFPDRPMQLIQVGDDININAGQLFTRYLEKARTVKITEAYLDELTGKNKTRSHRFTDAELGSAGVAAFNRAEAAIAEADWTQLPISPIDYIKQKLVDAGHSIGEITGRSNILKYESAEALASGIVTYQTREHGTAQKKQVMDDFQNGRLDAIITNSTTGYSLHASRTVADQRQRVMYLVQPHLDVNQVEQSIGRSHRSGQVDPSRHAPDSLDEHGLPQWGQYPGTFGLPAFKLVVGQDLPTEERAVAILMKKMSHLKANTTGNRSSNFGLIEVPDFINNYGNEVAQKLMEQDENLHAALDYPLGFGEELKDPQAIQKVTGRAILLTSNEPPTPEQPYPSLARQAWLYDTLSSEYKEFLAQKIALGENELEAQKLDLQAEPKARLVLSPGDSEIDSPFTKPAYLVEVLAKTGAKPNTTEQIVNAVRQELGFEPVSLPDDYALSQVRETGQQVAQDTVRELRAATEQYMQVAKAVKEAEVAASSGRMDKYQQKLDVATENYTGLQQQQEAAAKFGNTELLEKLTPQLAQQQPKIDKLKTQLSKAKLDLNGKEFQLAKEQRNFKGMLEEVSALIRQFPVGQPVRLIDKETKNYLYGVVAAVEQKNRANNPSAPGNWKLKLLVIDGTRNLSVRLDSLVKGGKQALERVETAPSFLNIKQESSVYELFDQRQTETKEKRYLVSGQILASELTGKFAQVTDEKGQVHPVYLLQRGFDPAVDMNQAPVMLENAKQIKQFLFDSTERLGIAQTPDENLTVIADIRRTNPNGIVIKTAKATAQGGIYFKDEGLRELVGDFVSKTESVREGNFAKSQSFMVASVSTDRVDVALNYLCGKWGLGATSHKDVARVMIGQVLPGWEPCSEINPDAPRLPATRAVPRVAVNDLQQTSATVSTPQIATSQGFEKADSAPGEESLTDIWSDRTSTASPATNASITFPASIPTAIASETLEQIQAVKQIALANNQTGSAEKNIAKLLHQGGLAAEILKGEDFYLLVANEPFTPLSIERHGQELYLTHYLKDSYGDLFLDAEMVFKVSFQGQLTLAQTATQNPFNGGEYRSNDRRFGQTFSSNLLAQGFGAAALSAFQTKQQSQSSSLQEQVLVEVENLQQTEVSRQLGQVPAVATKSNGQPLKQSSAVATVVSNPLAQGVVEPSLQPEQATTKESLKTKPSLGKSSASTQIQIEAPKGVQLSLFDVGLSPIPAAEVKSVPQSTAKVEKEPTLTVSQVSEPVQGAKETVVTPQVEAPPINKESYSSERLASPIPSLESATSVTETVDPMRIFQQVVERVDKRTDEMLATLNSSSPSLNMLRDWYKAARELGKSQKHLDRISQTGNNFKQGEPLTDKAIEVMTKDFQAHYKQLMVVEQLGNLGDRDLFALHQNITNYLNSPPPTPPAQVDRQKVELEVSRLTEHINALGLQQTEQLATVEAMQKSPFRSWNGKYEGAVAQVEQTANKLDNATSHLQQKQNQLGQWNKQEMAYSLWDKSPQTVEMRNLAKGLQSPQLQERLNSIAKVERHDLARSQASSNRQAGLSA